MRGEKRLRRMNSEAVANAMWDINEREHICKICVLNKDCELKKDFLKDYKAKYCASFKKRERRD